MQSINLQILILILCSSTSIAIHCYKCTYESSEPDLSCYGPSVSETYLVDCSPSITKCSTRVTGVSLFGISSTSVKRDCAFSSTTADSCLKLGSLASGCTRTCAKDGCNTQNGSKMVDANLITCLLTFCISLFFLKL